jgi:hypothetical protein
VVLTGRPEELEVEATRRTDLEAGHGLIEADTGAEQETALKGWTSSGL